MKKLTVLLVVTLMASTLTGYASTNTATSGDYTVKLIETGAADSNAVQTFKPDASKEQVGALLSKWNSYDISMYSYPEIGYFNGYFYLQEHLRKKLHRSEDGINWTFVGNMNETPFFDSLKYINGEYITDWGRYSFLTSPDLVTWKEIQMYRSVNDDSFTSFDLYGGFISDFAYGKGKYLAVGSIDNNVGGALILASEDFYNWRVIDAGHIIDNNLSKVMFVNDTFFALGNGLYKSKDGEAWIKLTDLPIRNLVYANDMFWGIAEGALMKSKDGEDWIKVNVDFDIKEGYHGTYLTYGGGVLMLFEDGFSDDIITILTSTDGDKWIKCILAIPEENSMLLPIYGNGVFLNKTDYNLFSDKKENPKVYYSKVLNPKIEGTDNQDTEGKYEREEINVENLVPMEDSLSLVLSPEVIARLQSYPYAYGENPKFNFAYMKLSGEANSIVEYFYRDIASFKDNETFFTHRDLAYLTDDYNCALRGLLRIKSDDGSITEQDIEYEFKGGTVNESKPGGVDYVLVAKRILRERKGVEPFSRRPLPKAPTSSGESTAASAQKLAKYDSEYLFSKIGESKEDIIKEYGKPDEIIRGDYDIIHLMKYRDKKVYFCYSNKEKNKPICAVAVKDSSIIINKLHTGMRLKEVEELYGTPNVTTGLGSYRYIEYLLNKDKSILIMYDNDNDEYTVTNIVLRTPYDYNSGKGDIGSGIVRLLK